ncbi:MULTISPECIES: phosphomannomutase CpsG [Psychrobacter]|jgi:phosphomannomutase|uniref:phosphomannomutase n=1 Tax=Psychrobacter pocilloporae TaxID=1775882 RepID=A0ABT6IPU3_9GAMM|nr:MULTISPECIES: phosphomannomutase CpsG [Psychrobacter]MDH4903760.1 phosphomannomutase CpsG [Psychrobacter pocilloporae]BBI65996.1 bifunctional protein [Psychrobacter sp. KH172YL61]HBL95546.1 phosphomannomutase CpsG [Psychrobacter sp.]|tara:strand:- start:142 stop:1629 length:1488 start_codon:yes stop_codon:yes gene_type:complete
MSTSATTSYQPATEFNAITINSFKAYDIRGELGVNLDEDIAYRIGRAFAQILYQRYHAAIENKTNDMADLKPAIVIGSDIRHSSEQLKQAAIRGIVDAGVDVIDLGMSGTEEVYFATSYYQALGGIEVTASHNPINYNGLKLVKEHSKPISADDGLAEIQALAESGQFTTDNQSGQLQLLTDKSAYIDHVMTFIDIDKLKPLKLVVNSGNGSAGPVVDLLINRLTQAGAPIEIITLHHTPDGSFPNGIPNPMIEANRLATQQAVLENKADLGIAFDGDFDRCFLFDENGVFIDGSYIVGMLAQAFLNKYPSESIVYDPRVIYNTEAVIEAHNGNAVISKSGHSFIKQIMRDSGAVYGGEMSAHHYFRDFFYCDSGMIPWLLTIELLSITGKTLSELVTGYIQSYPSSGELNFRLTTHDAPTIISAIEEKFSVDSPNKSLLDGLSLNFGEWRFNLRASNTEPLIRLNIESRGDHSLLASKTQEIQQWLAVQGAVPA